MTYQPLYIKKYETALVQSRQNFILPDDAYPVLENAFIWRERIKRKSGYKLLGRLRRVLEDIDLMVALDGAGNFTGNLRTILQGLAPPIISINEPNSEIEIGSLIISDGTNTYTDNGLGDLVGNPAGLGTINYSTMAFTITGGAAAGPLVASFNYYPNLPVMGLRSQELTGINSERTIAFDTVYAYRFVAGWQQVGTQIWNGTDFNFFWSTNYWVGNANEKIFWVTNFSGTSGTPIRYINTGLTAWIDFTPIINAANDRLNQCLCIVPFRSRLVTFNTWEGQNLATSVQYRQRIRWAAIGNPFTEVSAIVTTVSVNAWRDDIQGKGGFLDIPTAEDIVSVGFVRDNLVIYCERSTWQLRYTGRSIAPFQIEKVNTELGAESTFSTVQFDTSLVGIGDKGVVECDSYKSNRIDIKIPDLVFRFNNNGHGTERVHGIRDFQQRIAYWTYPDSGGHDTEDDASTFPNRRLVYNYENDSWAIFIDSFTALGTFQPTNSKRWLDFPNNGNPKNTWVEQNYPWINEPALFPAIIGGNQQGYVEFLGQSNFEELTSNDVSLSITNITGRDPDPTRIESINHNLQTGTIIKIIQIPTGTPFASSLNGKVFMVDKINDNIFDLKVFDPITQEFNLPQLDAALIPPEAYIGGGQIIIRDNFLIQSKKFNFLDQGQNIQLGYMDILMENTDSGSITMNVYIDYNESEPINTSPQNGGGASPDTFFNAIIPTFAEVPTKSSKNWQRIYCNSRGGFITLEFTLSNAQMNGVEQEEVVQIDAQILYMRPAGRQLALGA